MPQVPESSEAPSVAAVVADRLAFFEALRESHLSDVFLLTEEQAAALLGYRPKTMADRRLKGLRPDWVRLGSRTVRYRVSDLAEFVRAGVTVGTAGEVK